MRTENELMALLFGQYRRQLLSLLLLRPEESFYVRELERLSGIPAGSLHRELVSLSDAGLLHREHLGNQVRYRANRQCPLFDELASVFRKGTSAAMAAPTAPVETREPEPPAYAAPEAIKRGKRSKALQRLSVTKRALLQVCRKYKITKLSLFGSVTRDDFRPDSDVDVLVEWKPGEGPGLFGLVDLRDELTQLFGRTVDVVTTGVFRNEFRRRTIERDLECIYAA
jgi:predicted nucleotidyltransferase/DNA-binding transcriptional ArsR family regulator